jgi:hypothetical protein
MAGLDRVAVVRLLVPGIAIGQGLTRRTGERIGMFIVGEILAAEERFADELGVLMLVLFTVEGVVFDIVAQLVFFEVNAGLGSGSVAPRSSFILMNVASSSVFE